MVYCFRKTIFWQHSKESADHQWQRANQSAVSRMSSCIVVIIKNLYVTWTRDNDLQECIPVGCVPPACRPYPCMHCAGGCLPREVSAGGWCVCPGGEWSARRVSAWECPWGCVCPGGVSSRGCGKPPPPVNRLTDRCKNITLPQLRCGGGG